MTHPHDTLRSQVDQFLAAEAGHGCNCEELRDRLYEFLDRELADSDAARLRRHVDECPSCHEAADAEQHIRQLLRRSCTERAPQELRAKVVAQLTILRTTSIRTEYR